MLEEQIIEQIIKADKQVTVIYLFGSQANGTSTPQSDIDIAIYSNKHYSNIELYELKQTLELFFSKNVDIVNLKKTDPIINIQITNEGKLIFDPENYANLLENKMMNEYQNLQENPYRQEQIQDLKNRINNRGKING